MLKLKDEAFFRSEPSSAGSAKPGNVVTLASILGAIRRHMKSIVVIFTICLGAAIAYLTIAPPRYTASTSLMIDTRKSQIIRTQFGSDPPLDASIIESQAEIIKSDDLLMKVVKEYKLIEDPEFAPQSGDDRVGLWDSWLGQAPAPMSTEALERTAAFVVSKNLSVKRVGLSYVLDLRYVSRSPVRAMQIANAIANAYTNGETEARYDATRKANSWLKERLAELREQTITADRTLQAFKADINSAATSAEAQVTLRNLESTVTATKSLYDAYLQRSIDTAQQQDVPMIEARIIKTASVPLKPSSPNVIIILGLAVVGACGLSGLHIVVRQGRIQTFDTADRVETATGLRCLGVLPDHAARRGITIARAARGGFDLPLARSVGDAPFDRPFRQLKLELDARCRDTACVVGITSSLPREGKSLIAFNLALTASRCQERVLLIDAACRGGGLSTAFDVSTQHGLRDVLSGQVAAPDAVVRLDAVDFDFLPSGSQVSGRSNAAFFNQSQLEILFKQLRPHYHKIYIDLPSVHEVIEVKSFMACLDEVLLVVEADRTQTKIVVEAASALSGRFDMVGGVVLNRARPQGRSLAHEGL